MDVLSNLKLLPTTGSGAGVVLMEGVRFIHAYTDADSDLQADTRNVFMGYEAGNFTMGPAGGAGVLGGRNVGIGYRALKANTTGWQNTAVGHISQQKNTTGLYNTSLGAYSLAENTTGENNVAIGADSLWLNTTGSYNSSLGTYIMQQNTTGSSNTAMGYKALFSNTTGSNNVAIGNEALKNVTTTNQNIAIGYQAMMNNNSVGDNVAIGAFSMFAVSGGSNTGVGTYSMQSITSGTDNTAIGYGANSTATTGSGGVYIGSQSAWNITTGQRNVFLGFKSGYNADTESDNVIIGYDQRLKFDGEDGQLNIQSIIFGRGNTGNNATLSTGKIGIGVVDPQARLDLLSTTEQLRLSYDASNYVPFTVNASGDLTIAPTGQDINITGNATASFAFLSPKFATNATLINANFFTNGSSGTAVGLTTTNAIALFGGATNVDARTIFGGQTTAIAVGNSASDVIFAGAPLTKGSSGTHAWFNNVTINGFAINTGSAVVTNAASLYVNAAPTGATNVYSVYVAAGATYLGGTIQIAGGSPGSGKVLTGTDSLGNATWQTPSGGGGDTLTSEGALINSATAKTTPVDADYIGLMDSAASNILKKLSWADAKSTLKAYNDTLYQPVDSDLTAIAGLTATTNNFIVSVAGAWASRTPAQVKTTLSLENVDNTSDANKPVSTAQQTALDAKVPTSRTITLYNAGAAQDLSSNRTFYPKPIGLMAQQAAGSTIKGLTVGVDSFANISTTFDMADGTRHWIMVYLPEPATLTGVKFYVSVTGVFTADNTNGIALYTLSGTTLTQVATTANDANIWKQAGGQVQTATFTSTYVAAAGVYWACLLYNSSAQTTAPKLGAAPALGAGGASSGDMTNGAFLLGTQTAQTTLPATIATSSINVATQPKYLVGLY